MNNKNNLNNKNYLENYMTTIQDVLDSIDSLIDKLKNRISINNNKRIQNNSLISSLEQFKQKIIETKLFKLESGWFYSYLVEPKSITLSLNYLDMEKFDINNDVPLINHLCDLVIFDLKSLSISEYSKKYNLESLTVRQWIRRGKLLDVYKIGNNWRIPEIAIASNYDETHEFIWKDGDRSLPKPYAYLTKSKIIHIYKNDGPNNFIIYCPPTQKTITRKEKEKIELMLISNPMINYKSNIFIRVLSKEDTNI